MMYIVRVLDLYCSSLFPLYWTCRQVKYCFALVLGSVIRHCTHNVLFVLDPCLAGHGRFYVLCLQMSGPPVLRAIALGVSSYLYVFEDTSVRSNDNS